MAILLNDDNLAPGMTYTFTFSYRSPSMFYTSTPSEGTILQDLDMFAPSYFGSTQASWSRSVLTYYLNVTFTYIGDGSDVVSDVVASMLAAFKAGSGDDFAFEQATAGTAGISSLSAVTTIANDVGAGIGSAVGNVTGSLLEKTTSGLVGSAWPVLLVAGLGFAAYILFTTGGLRQHG